MTTIYKISAALLLSLLGVSKSFAIGAFILTAGSCMLCATACGIEGYETTGTAYTMTECSIVNYSIPEGTTQTAGQCTCSNGEPPTEPTT